VLVARSENVTDIADMAKRLRPDRLQVSEIEDPDEIARLAVILSKTLGHHRPAIAQVVHIGEATDPDSVLFAPVEVIHFDTAGRRPGGNNMIHNWEITRSLADRAQAAGKQTILAGGLRAKIVAAAIEAVQPSHGVDIETYIQDDHGNFSQQRGREFIEVVRDSEVLQANEAL
jgi:phosphoribosylanthranilate isomerase